MINLKLKYQMARDRAIELMNRGLVKEYIEQLEYMNSLKLQLVTLNN
ncbi:MAG: hypothetical protein ACJAY9_000188 [Flavobacteriales bacterium]|jgi:hypothetical protein